MAETFKRITSRGVGAAPTRVGDYTVPAGTTAIVIGMSVANVTPDAVTGTVEHSDGTNLTAIVANVGIPTGQSLAPCGEMNKLILEAGDGVFVTSSEASSLDVVIGILEIS